MRAKFELEYTGKSNIEVFSQVDLEVESDEGKLDMIDAIAEMLGVRDRILIRKPIADELWEKESLMTREEYERLVNHEGNEAHE